MVPARWGCTRWQVTVSGSSLGNGRRIPRTIGRITPPNTFDPNDLRGDRVDTRGESVARRWPRKPGLRRRIIKEQRITGTACAPNKLDRRCWWLDNRRAGPGRCACATWTIWRGQTELELSAIHLVRDRRDFTAAMPLFITGYIEAMTGKNGADE